MPSLRELYVETLVQESGYSYDEACDIDDLTPEEVKKELKKHSADWNEFVKEVGNKPKYTGQEVLDWLGY